MYRKQEDYIHVMLHNTVAVKNFSVYYDNSCCLYGARGAIEGLVINDDEDDFDFKERFTNLQAEFSEQ